MLVLIIHAIEGIGDFQPAKKGNSHYGTVLINHLNLSQRYGQVQDVSDLKLPNP